MSAPAKPTAPPSGGIAYASAKRRCGKCSTDHRIADGGGKRHPILGWTCAACAGGKK